MHVGSIRYYRPFYSSIFYFVGDVTLTIGTALSETGSHEISNIFNFQSNSPILIVVDSTVLDREELDSYIFTVVATDRAGQMSTAVVTIDILDFNDEQPVITNDG